jgi:hypothetical protein
MRWTGYIARTKAMKNAYTILIGKHEPTTIWMDNIKIKVKEVGCEGVDWILDIKYRVQCHADVNTVMNLRAA